MQPVVLSIAGFDPSSGAGVTADIKTAASHGCYAITCVTALTVQNTLGVRRVEAVLAGVVAESLYELAQDFSISAVRIGMLGSGEVAEAVAGFLETTKLPNVVLDPIIRSSSGADLLDHLGLEALRNRILPIADLVTPNMSEAEALTGVKVRTLDQMRAAGQTLISMGAKNVAVTGGHLEGKRAIDLLFWRPERGGEVFEEELGAEHLDSKSTHGTGCAFATSVACHLARGFRLPDAVSGAKNFVLSAIEQAEPMGQGKGPMELLWTLKRQRTDSKGQK